VKLYGGCWFICLPGIAGSFIPGIGMPQHSNAEKGPRRKHLAHQQAVQQQEKQAEERAKEKLKEASFF
jgi:hypothetical protein